MKADAFLKHATWASGPHFLLQPESEWPVSPDDVHQLSSDDPEVKRTAGVNAVKAREEAVTRMIHYFDSWTHLRKSVAWILRFKTWLLSLSHKRRQQHMTLAQSDLDGEQQQHSLEKDMGTFKGRTASHLLLRHIHDEVGHGGRNHMLSKLHEKYWIPGASSAIRKVLSKCIICRRLNAQPVSHLPSERVTPDEPPFTHVGVDYFGPFEVKSRRSLVKRYRVIFTCLAIRAIHIEVAPSLDRDSFINALRRFIARRGQVKELRSDNGTNFIGAKRELRTVNSETEQSQINDVLQKGIKWTFNPPTGSHHGGPWERLIRSVKKVLNSTLNVQNLHRPTHISL